MSKKRQKDETVAEWYERITGQGIGALTGQGTSNIVRQ